MRREKNIIGYFENFAVMSPRKRLCFRVVFEIMTKVVLRASRQFFFVRRAVMQALCTVAPPGFCDRGK